MGRIEINRLGYVKQLEGKNKFWIVRELISNCLDEEGVTSINVTIDSVPEKRQIHLIVEDDAPQGFKRLSDAYTLWTESLKVNNPELAGRFNEGEKKVILFSEWAEIVTTKGTIRFEGDERIESKGKLPSGTTFTAVFKGTNADRQDMIDGVRKMLPPANIKLVINNEEILFRPPLMRFEWTLPTVVGADLRPSQRKTEVRLYNPQPGNVASIYECGIPVVETCDKYDIDVGQKVPLNRERDNVPPAYLKLLRALTLNGMHDVLPESEFTKPWVAAAVVDKHVEKAAVNSYLDAKYTKDRVAFDPTNPESGSVALASGFHMVYGRNEPKEVWDKAREGQLIQSAGQRFPARIEVVTADSIIPESDWTDGMRNIAVYSKWCANKLIGGSINVTIVNDVNLDMRASFGQRSLTYNAGQLSRGWFDHGPTSDVNSLLMHELTHFYEEDHLSRNFYKSMQDLCGRLVHLALLEPETFKKFGWKP